MEQIRNLDQLLEYAKEVGPKKISVACAEDAEVMEAVENARKAGIANAFLVGNADKIKEVTDKLGIDLANYEIVDERGGRGAQGRRTRLQRRGPDRYEGYGRHRQLPARRAQ